MLYLLNTLREKGNWIEEGNCIRGSMNDLLLRHIYSNIKAQLDNVIEQMNWGDDEVTVKEIIYSVAA